MADEYLETALSVRSQNIESTGGSTRLWIESLGLPAVLPLPEEVKKVETAIGAARVENLRDDTLQQAKH